MARTLLKPEVVRTGKSVEVARKTVLVVDDEEPFLLSLLDALAPHASLFRVVTALSGLEALDLVGCVGPDLVITDLRMPGMDGLTLMGRLRSTQPLLPLIVMTAYNSPEIERELKVLRPAAVLEKPIDLDDLFRAVARALYPIDPPRGASGAMPVALLLLLSLLAGDRFLQHGGLTSGRLVQAGTAAEASKSDQNWRIATCSDPRV